MSYVLYKSIATAIAVAAFALKLYIGLKLIRKERKVENGKYNASLTLAHKAAQFFGTTIEELFTFEDDENL